MAEVSRLNAFNDCDVIVPVPLHPERLRWRGYNQALLLARRVGKRLKRPVDGFSLTRTRNTQPQVELRESERRRNVTGAFAVVEGSRLQGKKILLVDDVYTSGATAGECARVLTESGAENVSVLTLARAV
jgi:ComF family protein